MICIFKKLLGSFEVTYKLRSRINFCTIKIKVMDYESGPRTVEEAITGFGPISEHSLSNVDDTLELLTIDDFHCKKTKSAIEFWMLECGKRIAF